MKLIVGLGNPGFEYKETRHNIGFMVLDEIAKRKKVNFKKKFFYSAKQSTIYQNKNKLMLIKPQLFMNRSGEVVSKLVNKYKINLNDLVVIYDDIDLNFGTIRIREKGSAGTHNGMKSIINNIDSNNFKRIRVGIGPRPLGEKMNEYVLGNFKQDEYLKLEKVVVRAADTVERLFSLGIEKTMSLINNLDINESK
ncbi:MAG: aminoacyl-tRNA hydrolase [Pontiellaceae bacterium]